MAGIALLLALAVAARGDGVSPERRLLADGLSWIAKIVIVIGAGLSGRLSVRGLPMQRKYHGAYAALLLAATLGMMVLVSSKDLITMYVGLETSAISLYGLAAIAKRDDLSLEAGIKYLVIGALSSGILLYGLAPDLRGNGLHDSRRDPRGGGRPGAGAAPNVMLITGAILLLLGVGFKLSMVPMHVWTPDVYQGAPTPVAAFISVVSKSAGFVFAIRLFTFAFADLRQFWEPAVMVGAVLSMTVGNLAAIPQKSAKRLLAYSTISQAGYLLVGFLGSASTGTSAVVFYLFVYTVSNIAAFAAVTAFSTATGSDDLEDYAGLARREPVLALAFTFALLSLAGIPPLGGFIGQVLPFRRGHGERLPLAGDCRRAEQRRVPVLLPARSAEDVHQRTCCAAAGPGATTVHPAAREARSPCGEHRDLLARHSPRPAHDRHQRRVGENLPGTVAADRRRPAGSATRAAFRVAPPPLQ